VRRTVLIVDDHADFREAARALPEAAASRWSGTATGLDAVAAAGRLEPEIVLLNVQLPDQDGIAVAAELARHERRRVGEPDLLGVARVVRLSAAVPDW
jgi:CheY-like chemotaxis protein